ncbi:MAG: ATP-binding protein [Pseudomonadota bacterium]
MRPLSRLLPDRLAGRFALLLTCALVVANVIAFALLSVQRSRFDQETRAMRAMHQIVTLVPALEAVEPSAQRNIARDASSRTLRIRLADIPSVQTVTVDRQSRTLLRDLERALPDRDIRLRIEEHSRGFNNLPFRRDEPTPRWAIEIGSIEISIRLNSTGTTTTGAEWLNARTRYFRPEAGDGGPWPIGLLAVPLLSLIVVLIVGLLFVRRLTRPLARLADATRAAGEGDRTVRVPEEGAHELKAAAAAFNDMQSRIEMFEAERMRTLAAVGHDLRTPITSLRIRAEMLEPKDGEPMIQTLDQMTVMTEGFMAYAKGAHSPEVVESIKLSSLLKQVCRELGADLSTKSDPVVRARPVAIQRALSNLIENAIRYGEQAHVTLDIQDNSALIEILDCGPGIPADQVVAVFEPFVRGEYSRNSETGGHGLGLSIARNIIAAHGGQVRLENAPKLGLRVEVTLPLAR